MSRQLSIHGTFGSRFESLRENVQGILLLLPHSTDPKGLLLSSKAEVLFRSVLGVHTPIVLAVLSMLVALIKANSNYRLHDRRPGGENDG